MTITVFKSQISHVVYEFTDDHDCYYHTMEVKRGCLIIHKHFSEYVDSDVVVHIFPKGQWYEARNDV